MKLETFFDNFELLADVPNGVQKLQELILQLAVRGKLVPQDMNDEPAGMLVEKLMKEKKIKKTNDLMPIHENEIPYETPVGWKWVRLGNIFSLKTGATPSTKNLNYWNGNIRWLKSGDVNQGEIFDCEGRITEKGLENSNCKILPIDSVLIALNGQGKTRGTVAMLRIEAACNQSLVAMISENKEDFIPEYLLFFLKANYMNIRNITGHKQRRGLNMKIVGNLLAALPPSNEQRRIIAKVAQLMSLCDELEARQQKKRESRAHLNSTALDRLLAARAPGEFAEGWRRICDNFELLYDTPENVGALRQAALQLAVMGKLVAQDANDEPASILIEKIKAEKERLIKENKIKKSDISLVEPDELLNTLPSGWVLSNINEISLLVTDGEHQTPPRISNSEIPLGTAKNVRDGYLDLENTDYVSMETAIKCWKRCEPMHDDILMVCVGATTGRLCLLKKSSKFVIVRSVALVRPFPDYIYPEYVATAMKSPIVQSQVWKNVKQSAQPCLYINKINVINIPIPPLAEQRRIVAKVNQLMSLCDELEAGLAHSQADGERLMEAVVGRMLEG